MTALRSETLAARITRVLTVEILRGTHPVGGRIPTVRALAQRFEVTPATVQRALAGLEMTGLVRARQGSGTTVNDPEAVGGLGLVSAWLEASMDCPERAGCLLADFLEVRRIVATRLLVRHRHTLLAALPELMSEAAAFAEVDPSDVGAVREADLRFARRLLGPTGNTMALSVLNTAADVVRTVPHVAEAMYAEPDAHLASFMTLIHLLRQDHADLAASIDRLFAEIDAATVRRFTHRLQASG